MTLIRLPPSLPVVALLLAAASLAQASDRFVQKIGLRPGLVAVVAEGDLEARSTGSYSVRVYADPAAMPENETTFYAAGLLRPRDGFVRSAAPLAIAGRKAPLLLVVVESAGSGSYLSADAFAIDGRSIRVLASVRDLAAGEDAAARIRRRLAAGRP